jgi:hypothetical protein
MAYTIYINTNTVLTTIDLGEVDSISTSLDLVGKNVNNYGEYINNNLVKLLTNFASPESPRAEQVGQIWYDTADRRLKLYDGIEFSPIVGSTVDGVEPLTTSTGDLWYDTSVEQLKVWYNNDFHIIGPAVSPKLGSFGIEPSPFIIRDQYLNQIRTPGVISAYGRHFGMVSTTTWAMEPSTATYYVGVSTDVLVREGFTIFKDLEVRGTIYNNGTPIREFPKLDLSSSFDITRFGSLETAVTGTNVARYEESNRQMSDVLRKQYPAVLGQQYPTGSEARVVCDYTSMMTATSIVATVSTGSTTVSVNTTTGIYPGAIVQGSLLIPAGTVVLYTTPGVVELSNPVISSISSGTFISFNTVTTSVRHFRLDQVDVDSRQWQARELYTRSLLGWTGPLAVTNTFTSVVTIVGTQTGFYTGLQIEFVSGTPQNTGFTTVTNITVNLINTTTNLTLATASTGTAGTVVFNAHPVPFLATYTNIVI